LLHDRNIIHWLKAGITRDVIGRATGIRVSAGIVKKCVPMRVTRLDHVQLALPPGGEDRARHFYGEVLGIPEIPKPPDLAKRGGCWFERGDLKIHLGVETSFRPARKAHPALVVVDLPSLIERLKTHGYVVREDEPLEGFHRAYVDDPFGNRIELLEPHPH
jgi:catechol 2,3-dioxygenase-like lactoylglutathione lyase family enzyme